MRCTRSPRQWGGLAIAVLCLAARAQGSGGGTLLPGPDSSDCHSALRTGPTDCDDRHEGSHPPSIPAGTRDQGIESLDSRVERYLADFGKPPREAVRALLAPTDENILAMLRQQEQTLSIAGYVAARLTQLQSASNAATGSADPDRSDLATLSLQQVRLTLLLRPGEPGNASSLAAVRQLSLQWPGADARVAYLGRVADLRLPELIARIPPPLTGIVLREDDSDATETPLLVLEDLRSGRSTAFPPLAAGFAAMTSTVLAWRREAAHSRSEDRDPVGARVESSR